MPNAHHRICLVGFITDFYVMVGLIALPFFVFDKLGGGAAMSGTFMGAQTAAYAATCILASGMVARAKHGLRWALFGMILFGSLFPLLLFFRNPYVCGALAVAGFSGLAFVWPALHSWVGADPDPSERKRHMAWFNLSWSSGFVAAPFLAGPLCDHDYRLPFLLIAVLAVLGCGVLMTVPHERRFFGVASAAQLEARANHDRSSNVHLYAAWGATLVTHGLAAVARSVYPERVKDLVEAGELRLFFEGVPHEILTQAPATKFSWIASAMSVATALSFVVLGRTHGWRHRFSVLAGFQVAAAGACFVLGATRSLAVMGLCFGVIGAAAGVAFFVSAYYSVADPAHKHRRAALNEGAVGMGAFAGSIVIGNLAGRYGMYLPFASVPFFVGAALLVQAMLLRQGRARALRETNAATQSNAE